MRNVGHRRAELEVGASCEARRDSAPIIPEPGYGDDSSATNLP